MDRSVAACKQCKLRPPSRPGRPYCSKACSNAARAAPLADRFARYLTPGKPDECWLWRGACDKDGYGVIGDEHRRQLRAPRVAYELAHGRLPDGVNVLHTCDNPPCCNPAHLRAGSNADNTADMVAKGRDCRGDAHPLAKLTENDVRAIRAALLAGASQQSLANRYGVSQVHISWIKRRKAWRNL